MKLPLGQLASHLERGLSGCYLIAADEPLLVTEATDQIRRAAMERGFDERELFVADRGFRWESLSDAADNLSLFASRRIVELRMAAPKPGDAGARAIRALVEDPDPDRLVIISITSKLDRNTAKAVWVRAVEQAGVLVEIRPVTRQELPAFITRRARRHELTIDSDAAELLAARVEGNLLAADQELAKLRLIREDGHVDADAVLESVATSARFDVFRLSDAVVAGDTLRALTVLDGIRSEGLQPPLVLWALAREISLLSQLKLAARSGQSLNESMGRLRVWQSRQPVLRRALQRFSDDDVGRLMRHAAAADRAVKGVDRQPPWEAIGGLVLEMLAPRRTRLPT